MNSLRWNLREYKNPFFTVGGRHFHIFPARRSEFAYGYKVLEETDRGWINQGVFTNKKEAFQYFKNAMFGAHAYIERFSDECSYSK